jgi:NAD-dependent deacetylase
MALCDNVCVNDTTLRMCSTMSWADSALALQRLIENASDIAVLSGAGISTESGIPDFRSDSGVWQDPDLERTMSDSYLRRFPYEFWPKFKQVFMRPEYLKALPNAGHLALAELERRGKRVTVFTQNVDGLHQLAGSSRVFELHGGVRKAHCPVCRQVYGLDDILAEEVPICRWTNQKGAECGHVLHPDTVLFGQPVRHFEQAAAAVQACDLLLVLGTSLTVNPVAELPNYARRAGARLAVVNLDETYIDPFADVVIRARIGAILPTVIPPSK